MWRSILFVPVLQERFLARAAQRGADAVVLDLEASIVEERKAEAREALPDAVRRLDDAGVTVLVRINMPWRAAFLDLEAVVQPGVRALLLAGCESPEYVAALDAVLSEIELDRGLPGGGIGLIPLLESARAVSRAEAIGAAAPRAIAMSFGIEDYVADMQASHGPDLIEPAAFTVIQAARACGLAPLVVPSSIAELDDLEAFEAAARRARDMGSEGGFAIHPRQVACLNRAFSPSPEALAEARRVVEAADRARADGLGAVRLDGRMIDLPIVNRARQLLATGPDG